MIDIAIVDYLRANSDVEFEYVELGGQRRAGDPPRYFIADQRMYQRLDGSYDEPWVCIHNWTAAPSSLLRNLSWATRTGHQGQIWVFEARNKGQVAVWLEQYGYDTKYMGQRHAPMPAQERIIVNSRDRALAAQQAIIDRAQQRIDRIAALPTEPTTDDPDGALVVWFNHRFGPRTVKDYTYAAVKASDGLWYTTGPASPKGYTWDQLVEWHFTEYNGDNPMWVATEWDVVQ